MQKYPDSGLEEPVTVEEIVAELDVIVKRLSEWKIAEGEILDLSAPEVGLLLRKRALERHLAQRLRLVGCPRK